MLEVFAAARAKYEPETIKLLFVAEAPPKLESKRYFYFENVREQDSLFWEMMKVLYLGDSPDISMLRGRKREYLEKFRDDGCFLIDAANSPITDSRPNAKRNIIREALPGLTQNIQRLVSETTKIILITAPVYEIAALVLRADGLNIINNGVLPFPGSGQQLRFRRELSQLLREHGWRR